MLRVVLVTEGDPKRMSGGFLYHRRVVERADENDASVRTVSVPQRRYPLAVVDGLRVLRAAVGDADVMVVDSLASNTLGPWLAAGVGRRVPLVGSVHQRLGGIDHDQARVAVQRRFDALAWRRARQLIVASDLLADQLAGQGIPRALMTIVPPGRDVPVADAVEHPGDLRRGRAAAMLCVGNWLERKGIISVLDAVAKLPEQSLTLHLVGVEDVDAAYGRRVLDRLDRADLRGRVVRHGVVDPSAMAGLYTAADLFVLASVEEPYGTVYGEAMTFGLPVLGWDAGNLPHLANDGVEGRIVPTGNIDALSTAIGELCADEQLRQRIGAQARSRSCTLPTWDQTAEQFFATCRLAAAR